MSDWVPTREAWDKFLSLLDADQEVAGERYERIRRRLIIFFEGRRCLRAEDLADETIMRVIRKNYDGVHIDDVIRYSYGVAKIIKLEEDEIGRREDRMRDELLRSGATFIDPEDPYAEEDLRYGAFQKCMEKLSTSNRTFILNYYEDTGRAKIDNRKSLQDALGISKNAMTLRAYQVRKKLEKCIKSHLRQAAAMKQLLKDSH